ncbi:hypothetical protein EYC80_009182 [Monilinia laxa]|uniref:Uncharacterized protein n=1 Tax=Monilinia laxa TaxID=61186 RepID=A0A5N6K2U8_MONLA|nr:hypothetical protein EYC80_009182 [Monilinia laxa]
MIQHSISRTRDQDRKGKERKGKERKVTNSSHSVAISIDFNPFTSLYTVIFILSSNPANFLHTSYGVLILHTDNKYYGSKATLKYTPYTSYIPDIHYIYIKLLPNQSKPTYPILIPSSKAVIKPKFQTTTPQPTSQCSTKELAELVQLPMDNTIQSKPYTPPTYCINSLTEYSKHSVHSKQYHIPHKQSNPPTFRHSRPQSIHPHNTTRKPPTHLKTQHNFRTSPSISHGAWLVLGRRRGYDDQRDLGIWGFACGLGGVGGVGGSGGDDDDDDDDEGSLL